MADDGNDSDPATSSEYGSFENEYSLVNRIQSENCSIIVENNVAATKLALILQVASPQPAKPAAGGGAGTPVLEFTAGTAEDPGNHVLKVVEDAAGLLLTDEKGNIVRLAPPAAPSVLVFNEGHPQWLPVPDFEHDYLLGLDEEGAWKWYGKIPEAEVRDFEEEKSLCRS